MRGSYETRSFKKFTRSEMKRPFWRHRFKYDNFTEKVCEGVNLIHAV
jgi:hypothetical protein